MLQNCVYNRLPDVGVSARTSPRWTTKSCRAACATTMTRTSSTRRPASATFTASSATCRACLGNIYISYFIIIVSHIIWANILQQFYLHWPRKFSFINSLKKYLSIISLVSIIISIWYMRMCLYKSLEYFLRNLRTSKQNKKCTDDNCVAL